MKKLNKFMVIILISVLFFDMAISCKTVAAAGAADVTSQLTNKLKIKGVNSFRIFNDILYNSINGTLFATDLINGSKTRIYKSTDSTEWSYDVTAEMIYIKTKETVTAIDRMNGEKKWTFNRYTVGGNEIRMLSCEKGMVYISATKYNNADKIYALDVSTGKEKWTKTLSSKFSKYPFFHLEGNVLYFNTMDHIYAVDNETGVNKWNLDLASVHSKGLTQDSYDLQTWPLFTQNNIIYTSTLVSTSGGVMLLREIKLVALDMNTGKVQWMNNMISISSMELYKDKLLLGDNSFHVYNTETGQEEWQFKTGGRVDSIKVVQNVAYCRSDNNTFYALDLNTHQEKWHLTAPNSLTNSTALIEERFYFESNDGYFHVLDKLNGQEILQFKLEGKPIHSAFAVVAEVLYYLTDNCLYAVSIP